MCNELCVEKRIFEISTKMLLEKFVVNSKIALDDLESTKANSEIMTLIENMSKKYSSLDLSSIRDEALEFVKLNFFFDDYKKLPMFDIESNIHFFLDLVGVKKEVLASEVSGTIINGLIYDFVVISRFVESESIKEMLVEGKVSFKRIFGLSSDQIFDHYETHGDLLRIYSEGFVSSHLQSDLEFVENVFNDDKNKKILDVGGNYGRLGDLILSRSPKVSYFCYDLPGAFLVNEDIIESYKEKYSNFNIIKGDFFRINNEGLENIEEHVKYDVLIFGWVLHDWDDEKNISILKKCKVHCHRSTEIYVLEFVKSSLFSEWLTRAMANGYERSLGEYEKLVKKAGFKVLKAEVREASRALITLAIDED